MTELLSAPAKQVVVGTGISKTSYSELVETCRHWLDDPQRTERAAARYICVTSVHGIITAVFDQHVRRYLNGADVATPDGMPVVWAMRSFGIKTQTRVYGPNLMLHLCAMAEQAGRSIFLYGGKPDVVSRLRENLCRKFPNLTIAGTYSPPFRPLTRYEHSQIAATIRHSKADIVFVGLSTPKQEHWMVQTRAELPGTILVGVGAAFDFHANAVEQAPAWMQDAGLEWLFRLTREPRRLWKRYLVITPLFLPLWALQRVGILRYAEPEQ